MAPRSCNVLRCDGTASHVVRVGPDDAPVLEDVVCAEHWIRMEHGEPWVWEGAPDWRENNDSIIMGDDLTVRKLVVGDESVDLRMPSRIFSPHLHDDWVASLVIDGAVFGSTERAYLELVLTPETTGKLRRFLDLLP